jgi:hypothetical protein
MLHVPPPFGSPLPVLARPCKCRTRVCLPACRILDRAFEPLEPTTGGANWHAQIPGCLPGTLGQSKRFLQCTALFTDSVRCKAAKHLLKFCNICPLRSDSMKKIGRRAKNKARLCSCGSNGHYSSDDLGRILWTCERCGKVEFVSIEPEPR